MRPPGLARHQERAVKTDRPIIVAAPVVVAAPAIVAVHVHGNAPVDVIETVEKLPRMQNADFYGLWV